MLRGERRARCLHTLSIVITQTPTGQLSQIISSNNLKLGKSITLKFWVIIDRLAGSSKNRNK